MPSVRFEAILSNKRYDTRRLQKELEKAVNKTTDAMRRDFKKTTRTWDTKPVFEQVKAQTVGNDLIGATGTDNLIYRFVTRGTKAHTILAKKKPRLKFMTGNRPKTRYRVIGSSKGGSSGNWVSTNKPVKHPGTQAREFEEEISARHQITLENNVTAAILRVSTPK